jgi:hypothetical protein
LEDGGLAYQGSTDAPAAAGTAAAAGTVAVGAGVAVAEEGFWTSLGAGILNVGSKVARLGEVIAEGVEVSAAATVAVVTGVVLAVTEGSTVTPEQEAEDQKRDEARKARDERAADVASQPNRPATVTAGWNTETGDVATGCSGGGKCAEERVVDALGGDPSKVNFVEAVRPRPGGPPYRDVPICENCQDKYGPDQFPPGTRFK